MAKPGGDFKYFVARALDKYAPKGKDELSFKKGDLIFVLEENKPESKFRGEVIKDGKIKADKTGWFPTFYARRDDKEKLPELPPSLRPKLESAPSKSSIAPTTPALKQPTPVGTPQPPKKSVSLAEAPILKSRSSSTGANYTATIQPPNAASTSAEPVALTTAEKRARLQRVETIRTFTLQDESDDDDDVDVDTTEDDGEDEVPSSDADKAEYMKGVAAKMVSKVFFMQKKGGQMKQQGGSKKKGLFSSLRRAKDRVTGAPEQTVTDEQVYSQGSASPEMRSRLSRQSSQGIVRPPKQTSSAPGSVKNQDEEFVDKVSPPLSGGDDPAGGRVTRTHLVSKSTPDLNTALLESGAKSVNFDASTTTTPMRAHRRFRRRSSSAAKAVLVDDDDDDATPSRAQTATLETFNPEGKDIEIISELGKGATGLVWKGAIGGEFVAMKQIVLQGVKNPRAMRLALKEEVELMKPLNHPNVLKYYGMFYSKAANEINIVLELVEGVSVAKLVTRNKLLPENVAAYIVHQTAVALAFLEKRLIIHRDVKPQNLLVNNEGIVKLIDFGTVAKLANRDVRRTSTVGTPWYVAPEVINGDDYSFAADIWSVGCSIVELVSGKPPYHDMNSVATLFQMVEDEHPPLPSGISPLCESLLLQCFKRDWKQRPTPIELMEHAWTKIQVTQMTISKFVLVASMPTDSPNANAQ